MPKNDLDNSRGGTRTRDPGIMSAGRAFLLALLYRRASATTRHESTRSAPEYSAKDSAKKSWFDIPAEIPRELFYRKVMG